MQDFIEKAKAKMDELTGTKPKPEASAKPDSDKKQNAQVKPKPKPKCGQSGPYKDRNNHDNAGVNWDHVPSKAALLAAAKRLKGSPLTAKEITAITENAPTIAIPEKLHRDHSETFGGRQNQTVDGDKRIMRDSKDLSRAAKENTDKLEKEIDRYDKGCKGAYAAAAAAAAAEIVKKTNADWEKLLKQIMKEAKK